MAALWLLPSARAAETTRIPWESLASPNFNPIGVDQGLPHPFIRGLAQDDQGMIWVGTLGGLARFDGHRTRVYRYDEHDPASLPQDFVSTLHIDRARRLWVGTGSGLVARYEPATDRFTRFQAPGDGIGSAPSLAGDDRGSLWVSGSNGLFRLDVADGDWEQVSGGTSGLPAGRVYPVMVDRGGAVWAGTADGLYRRAPEGVTFTPVGGTRGYPVQALAELADGRILMGSGEGAFGWVDALGTGLTDVRTIPGNPAIRAIAETPSGQLWFGTINGGLVAFDPGASRMRVIRKDLLRPLGLPSDTISALLLDRAGQLWVGAHGALGRIDPEPGAFLSIHPALNPGTGISADSITALHPAGPDALWLGNEHSRPLLLTADGESSAYLSRFKDLPAAAHTKVLLQAAGSLWVGTSQGLYRLPDGGSTVLEAPALRGNWIESVIPVRDAIWVATREHGLFRLDSDGTLEAAYRRRDGDPSTLSSDSIETLLHDPQLGIWAGTRHGLNLVDPESGRVRRIEHDPADPTSLPGHFVSSLLLDRRGRLWVGTFGNGLGVLENREAAVSGRESPRFRRIGSADGLADTAILHLLEDQFGRMWSGTNEGLVMIDPDSFTVRTFGVADGVTHRLHWIGSGTRMADGTLVFGALGGLTVVRPDRLKPWTFQPPVVVTDIRVDNRHLPPSAPIVLQPRDRGFQVEFAALDYSAPGRNRYAYRLDGYDPDWVGTDAKQRIAAYTNLPPGSYRLLLRGSNRQGVWTDPPTEIPVTILPAWYQTAWFQAAVVLLVSGLALGLVQIRTAVLRQRQQELEREVAARTAKIAEQAGTLTRQRNELAGALTNLRSTQATLVRAEKLASLGQLVAGVAHEINTPLGISITAASHLSSELEVTAEAMARRAMTRTALQTYFDESREGLTVLTANLERAAALVQDFKKVASEGAVDEVKEVELESFVAEIVALNRPLLRLSGVTVTLSCPEPVSLTTCPGPLGQVVTNLVQNALHHAFAGIGEPRIDIEIARTNDGGTRIRVEDNGTGMPDHVREKAFDPFFTTRRGQGGTGLGLHIVHNLVTGPLQGSIDLDTAPGQGTRFTLLLADRAAVELPAA